MKTIKIHSLMLKNFKGIKDLSIDFEGNDANIFGRNELGKTTVYDSFWYLFFDKDSQGKSPGTKDNELNIKTRDLEGNYIHGLDHSVEANLDIFGEMHKLKKLYKEKWTKKRGHSERILNGHTTDYFIDEVPVKKKDYDEYISNIIDEDLFKLITNNMYFNEQLHWTQRRQILLDICGDIDDETVIESNKKLLKLKEHIFNTSVDEFRKKVKAKKKLLNDELKQIPIRIDELTQSLPEINENLNIEVLDAKKKEIVETLKEYDAAINDVDKSIFEFSNIQTVFDQKNKELALAKRALSNIEYEIVEEVKREASLLQKKVNNLTDDTIEENDRIKHFKKLIETTNQRINEMNEEIVLLRNKWETISNEKMEIQEDFECPVCHQSLPEDMKNDKINQLKVNFEKDKEKRLSAINVKGKQLKDDINVAENLVKDYQERIDTSEIKIKGIREQKAKIEQQIKETKEKSSIIDVNNHPKYIEMAAKVAQLEKDLDSPEDGVQDEKTKLLDKKSDLQKERFRLSEKLSELNTILESSNQIERTNKRIEDLRSQERELSNQIAELEGQEFMTEEFIRSKVNLLESRINEKFDFVKFKMFNILGDGTLEETCTAMVKGVPYSNLNNAARPNSGIDIINALTNLYGVSAPVFVDNVESINDVVKCNSQMIKLSVSLDEKLRVEVEKESERLGA